MAHHRGALSQTTGGRAIGRVVGAAIKSAVVCTPLALWCLLRRDYVGLSLCYAVYAGWIVRAVLHQEPKRQEMSGEHH
jgi:hypothetical protein